MEIQIANDSQHNLDVWTNIRLYESVIVKKLWHWQKRGKYTNKIE
jgi:hypothetical protein